MSAFIIDEVKLATQKKNSQGLREIADFYDAHPELKLPYNDNISVYNLKGEELADFARAMGKAEKVVDDWSFQLVKTFPSGRTLRTYTGRENVCERVVVGTETVAAQLIPAKEAVLIPATTKEVVEWRCPESILGLTND